MYSLNQLKHVVQSRSRISAPTRKSKSSKVGTDIKLAGSEADC